jgi:hypothetical protein
VCRHEAGRGRQTCVTVAKQHQERIFAPTLPVRHFRSSELTVKANISFFGFIVINLCLIKPATGC